jgi:hypothetical protein
MVSLMTGLPALPTAQWERPEPQATVPTVLMVQQKLVRSVFADIEDDGSGGNGVIPARRRYWQ